jgi:hypothetical protein
MFIASFVKPVLFCVILFHVVSFREMNVLQNTKFREMGSLFRKIHKMKFVLHLFLDVTRENLVPVDESQYCIPYSVHTVYMYCISHALIFFIAYHAPSASMQRFFNCFEI